MKGTAGGAAFRLSLREGGEAVQPGRRESWRVCFPSFSGSETGFSGSGVAFSVYES